MGGRRAGETGYGMSDNAEYDVERPGIDRRTLIKRTAAAGAVAWAAPTIIGSLASPAGAVTGAPFPCSYATVVVQPTGGGALCAVKITGSQCQLDNHTSSDNGFDTCGFNNNNGTNGADQVRQGTTVIAACGSCPVTFNGAVITANNGFTIVFAITHQAMNFTNS